MNFKKLFGYGVLIWAAAYLVATLFVAYKMMNTITAEIVVSLVGAVAAYFAARNVKARNVNEIMTYSIPWVGIAIILDIFLTVPFAGWTFFSSWSLWIGYFLVAVVPVFSVKK